MKKSVKLLSLLLSLLMIASLFTALPFTASAAPAGDSVGDLTSNVNTLKNYIKNYGDSDGNGGFYVTRQIDNGSGYFYFITLTLKADGSVEFWTKSLNGYEALQNSVTFDLSKSYNFTSDVWMSGYSNNVFTAKMVVDARTYNPASTSYSVTTTQTNGDYSSSEIATNTRKATSEALERYNVILKQCTGLQLGDLGFGNYPKSIIDPTGIKLNTTALTITAGTKYTLKATISPSNATNKTVYWSSSNTAIAGMKSGGVVNAKKAGTCTVTAKTVNGKTATCKVTVKAAPAPTGITVSPTSVTMSLGTTFTIKATVQPSYANNKTVYWSSSNPKVASMGSGGVATAKGLGTCTITAKTVNGKTATCKITVKPSPTGIKLNYSALTMTAGTTFTLKATVSPSSTLNKKVTWSTSSSAVATVSSSGVVSAKKAGTCTITAKTFNGKTASCKITVKSKTVVPTGISLNYSSLTMTVGTTFTLKVTVSPSNATDKSVTWSSSDTAKATVSSSGVVTAKKPGAVTITAKTSNGKTATCKITVRSVDEKYLSNFHKLWDYIDQHGTASGQGKSLEEAYDNIEYYITANNYNGSICFNYREFDSPYYYDVSVTWNLNNSDNAQVTVSEGDGETADNWETSATINVKTYNGTNVTFTDEYGYSGSSNPKKYLNNALKTLDAVSKFFIRAGVKDIGFAAFTA